MLKEQLTGTWRLVSVETHWSTGKVGYPYGRNPKGMLFYDEKGNMSATITKAERSNFSSDNMLKGTPEETKAAFDSYLAYCGTYEVNEAGGYVSHTVECSLYPNWVGTELIRYAELKDSQLTLTAPPLKHGDLEIVYVLTWEKI